MATPIEFMINDLKYARAVGDRVLADQLQLELDWFNTSSKYLWGLFPIVGLDNQTYRENTYHLLESQEPIHQIRILKHRLRSIGIPEEKLAVIQDKPPESQLAKANALMRKITELEKNLFINGLLKFVKPENAIDARILISSRLDVLSGNFSKDVGFSALEQLFIAGMIDNQYTSIKQLLETYRS